MFEPIKAPLTHSETIAKLNYYINLAPVEIKRTFLGSKVYFYEDGTKISLFGDLQCNIWDPKQRKWGYTSRDMAKQFATMLNRTVL